MARKLDLDTLLHGCADTSFDAGIRIDVELEPLAGDGGPVKPATYAGGCYQLDRRWASPTDAEPTDVIIIDNVPSQANRLEEALRCHRDEIGIPELVLDLSNLTQLPAHLPRRLSSLQFPHRNGDAYLRDATTLDGTDFMTTDLGKSIFAATPENCGILVAWFPQALLYGFWQSHLGNKQAQTKHARAWVSEIIGWKPASIETRTFGVKGDPLNLSIEEAVSVNVNDQTKWDIGTGGKASDGKNTKGKKEKLSEIGHGQVPFTDKDAALGPVSFSRITQRATVSFAQLRRLSLGQKALGNGDKDTAMRALLVAMGLHAHQLAFGHGFALRSGAALRPRTTVLTWLGAGADEECALGNANDTQALLESARSHAESAGVPLDGWDQMPTILLPKDNLKKAIASTWPELAD